MNAAVNYPSMCRVNHIHVPVNQLLFIQLSLPEVTRDTMERMYSMEYGKLGSECSKVLVFWRAGH